MNGKPKKRPAKKRVAAFADPAVGAVVATFRQICPKLPMCGGNRSVVLNADDELPEAALRHCVALALTHHLSKRKLSRR